MSDTREKLEQMGFRILDAVRTELLLSMRLWTSRHPPREQTRLTYALTRDFFFRFMWRDPAG